MLTIQLRSFKDQNIVYQLNPELFKYVIEFEDFNGFEMTKGTRILLTGIGTYDVAESWREVVQSILELDIRDKNDTVL